MIKGLVSTIIPVYNREQFIVDAISSVLAQRYLHTEIIVVDDGSTDATSEVVQAFVERHSNVILIRQDNAGPGVARQTGLEVAKGEYIQFLDSDDLLLPTKFSVQTAALIAMPSAVACYGKTELTGGEAKHNNVAWKLTGQKHETMFPEFFNARWWGTSTALYRVKYLRQIGPWLSTMNEEDWEYDCRVAALGLPLAQVDVFVSEQRRHDDHLSSDGSTDPSKLKDRAIAQQSIYKSARNSITEIPNAEFIVFSKSVFLLARECAAAGLNTETERLIALSIKAAGAENIKHRIFKCVAFVFGCRSAATVAKLVERLR